MDDKLEMLRAAELLSTNDLAEDSFEKYSTTQVAEMKRLGLPKPKDIPWSRWYSPEELNNKHEILCQQFALGKNIKQATLAAGFSETYAPIASQVLKSPDGKTKVAYYRNLYAVPEIRNRIKRLTPDALDVVERALTDDSIPIKNKLEAAKYIVDQAVGKAQQNINVEGSLIGEFLTRLDSRDVTTTTAKQLDKPKDAIDAFVDEFIPDSVKVGKREETQPSQANTKSNEDGEEGI